MLYSLYRKYLTHLDTPFLYECYSGPKMQYCYHIRTRVPQSSLSSIDRVKKNIYLRGPVDNYFPTYNTSHSSKQNVANVSLLNCIAICSNGLHSLVLPVQTSTVRTRYMTCTPSEGGGANYPYSPRIPLVRIKFYSRSFFLRQSTLWNGIQDDSSITTIFSNLRSTVTYPIHNLHLLLLPTSI